MLNPQTIDGATKLVGLIGYPVAHSISPQIHNHAFSRRGLPFVYVPLSVAPDKIGDAVAALRSLGFAGANVTIPHKRAVAGLCDELSPLSKLTGTVNTIYVREGALCGTTTDPEGFLRALSAAGHDPAGGHIVILGNGGVARALAFALARERIPARLAIAGRSEVRVSNLAAEVSAATGFELRHAALDSPLLDEILAECSLLVNCTSVGMYPNVDHSPLPAARLHPAMTVFDTVYNPAETVLVRAARNVGCLAQNGLRMLLYQALASFTYWTGVEAGEDLFDLSELQDLLTR